MTPTLVSRHKRLAVSDVVAELAHVLGAPMVAVLADVRDTRSVRQWIAKDAVPKHEDRLRTALQIADVILAHEQPDVARAWFAGLEPNLDDQNPLLLLKKDDHHVWRDVLDAARRFVAENA